MPDITARRLLYVFAGSLASAGLVLVIASTPARSSNHNTPPKATVSAIDKITRANTTRHQTWWICTTGPCRTLKDTTDRTSGYEDDRKCDKSECGHSSSDYQVGSWSYLGHQDRYNVQWSCGDGYEKPDASPVWLPNNKTTRGALPEYTATDIPDSEKPTCVRTPTLTVSDASAEEGDALAFTVTLRHVSGEVKWGTLSDSSGANPACFTCSAPNKDLNAVSAGTHTFPGAGGGSHTVRIPTIEDTRVEPDETFLLRVTGPPGSGLQAAVGIGKILNDDQPAPEEPSPADPDPTPTPTPTPTLTVSTQGGAEASVTEGNSITLVVRLSGASGTVTYRTRTGGDYGNASSSDFTQIPSTSRPVQAGEQFPVTVNTTQDFLAESDETFQFTATASYGDGQGTLSQSVTVTIEDDDEQGLSVSDVSVEEGGTARFTVTLNGRVGRVRFSTGPGTALADDDYDPAPSPRGYRFSSPGGSTTVSVRVKTDNLREKPETFYLRAQGPGGFAGSGDSHHRGERPGGRRRPGRLVQHRSLRRGYQCGERNTGQWCSHAGLLASHYE